MTNVCPRRSLRAEDTEWIALFAHYREGNLWTAGGISNQPQIYLEAMNLIQYWSRKLQEQ